MSDLPDDGGPAFPVPADVNPDSYSADMTLRDYLEGQAIQGILSNPAMIDQLSILSRQWVITHAGLIADAMIKARKGGRNE